jgi:hypothetical protein
MLATPSDAAAAESAAVLNPVMAIVTSDAPPEETCPPPPPQPNIIADTRIIKIIALDVFIFFIVIFSLSETLAR